LLQQALSGSRRQAANIYLREAHCREDFVGMNVTF
jgi:hypothetical protein